MKHWISALLAASFLLLPASCKHRGNEQELTAARSAERTPQDALGSSTRDAASVASSPSAASLPSGETAASDEVILDQAKQKRIWDNEHATFELETYFGKALQKAIRQRDPQAIEGFFLDESKVTLIPLAAGQSEQAAVVAETRADDSDTDESDVPGLANHLIQSLDAMREIQRSKLRVLQLQTEDGLDWMAQILLIFIGTDADQQPRIVESHHTLQLKFSSDEEIQAGRIIAGWRDDSRSTRHSELVLMQEVTEQTGLSELPLPDNWVLDVPQRSQYWFQAAVADFNHDDYPDIAAATINGKPMLLQSDRGQKFVDITAEMRLKSWDSEHMQGLATWFDFNNDGWPDLLLGNRLYRNVAGKALLDVTKKSGLTFGHFPMGTAVADYDCDGLLDLYIVYQHGAKTRQTEPMPWVGDNETGARNQLWRNEGGGRFRDVTEQSNSGGGPRHSFAAVWHFLDDDQYPDLYIANDFGQNVHLRNRGDGTLEDISDQARTADYATSMGVSTGDLDNDGRPELYVANMYSKMGRRIIGNVCAEDYPAGIFDQIRGSCAGNRLYTMRGDSYEFQEVSEHAGVNEVGWAYAPALADFDSDGLLDIYATTGFMSAKRGKPDG